MTHFRISDNIYIESELIRRQQNRKINKKESNFFSPLNRFNLNQTLPGQNGCYIDSSDHRFHWWEYEKKCFDKFSSIQNVAETDDLFIDFYKA